MVSCSTSWRSEAQDWTQLFAPLVSGTPITDGKTDKPVGASMLVKRFTTCRAGYGGEFPPIVLGKRWIYPVCFHPASKIEWLKTASLAL